MGGDINPQEWVDAWQRFVATTPVAGWSSTIIVGVLLLMLLVKGVLVPLITALTPLFKKK